MCLARVCLRVFIWLSFHDEIKIMHYRKNIVFIIIIIIIIKLIYKAPEMAKISSTHYTYPQRDGQAEWA